MARVKVIYASKHGSTREIAEAITDELRAAGQAATCVPAGEVHGLGDCDAVVLGSAVYMGRWRHEAKHVLRRHGPALEAMPFWVFSSGPVGDPAEEQEGAEKWLEPRRVIERAEELGVREHVVFGGSVSRDPHGFVERSMARNTPEEFQDRRDWEQIRAWARNIAAELGALVT
ncbi:MAG: flavodoxin domain-containing protein [Solirubrobacteraceae bacterium]|nr:flavodoxin domain-containing protein [Solirubrobacteraceae bacterium]